MHDPWQDELEDLRDLTIAVDGREQASTLVVLRELGGMEVKATTANHAAWGGRHPQSTAATAVDNPASQFAMLTT